AHLCDTEIALSMRIRMLLVAENYQFASFDEDAFVAVMPKRDARASVETFATLRRNNLDLLQGLSEAQLSRVGIRPNGEPITLIDYIARMSNHVRAHLEQAVAAAK
ncbi:MAG: DinB family protein, partial [bacterium]